FPTTLVIGLLLVAVGETFATRLACAVFVLTAGMLFGISAVYHRGTWTPQRAIMLRRFDHANIFLIIAGTYTPIAVTLLAPRQALTLLLIAWGGALVGVCFRLFWTAAPRWIYVPAYIALGWVAVFYMPALHAGGGWPVVWLLVIGGLAYTAGAVMYALKRPNPSPAWFGFHENFHAGTRIGFGCRFAAVAGALLWPAARQRSRSARAVVVRLRVRVSIGVHVRIAVRVVRVVSVGVLRVLVALCRLLLLRGALLVLLQRLHPLLDAGLGLHAAGAARHVDGEQHHHDGEREHGEEAGQPRGDGDLVELPAVGGARRGAELADGEEQLGAAHGRASTRSRRRPAKRSSSGSFTG